MSKKEMTKKEKLLLGLGAGIAICGIGFVLYKFNKPMTNKELNEILAEGITKYTSGKDTWEFVEDFTPEVAETIRKLANVPEKADYMWVTYHVLEA